MGHLSWAGPCPPGLSAEGALMRYGDMRTTKTVAATTADIKETFRKWGVLASAFDVQVGLNSAAITFEVNRTEQRLSCSRFYDGPSNLRAVYLILESLRLAAQRGIMEELARAAVAMLPPGTVRRPAHEVLEIMPNASLVVAEAAYRQLAKAHHPDTGGSDAAMTELNDAIDEWRKNHAS